jgi:hypothetical protein
MNTNSPSTRIGANTPLLLRYPPNGSLGSSLGREMMFENLPDPVCFFGIGSFEWETFVTACHLFVGNCCGGLVLHSVDPRVSYTIGELLLLSPEDRVGQVGFSIGGTVEGFSQDVLIVSYIHFMKGLKD